MLPPKGIHYLINGLERIRLERTATARRSPEMSATIFKNECSDFLQHLLSFSMMVLAKNTSHRTVMPRSLNRDSIRWEDCGRLPSGGIYFFSTRG
jgi:hypothetical protein